MKNLSRETFFCGADRYSIVGLYCVAGVETYPSTIRTIPRWNVPCSRGYFRYWMKVSRSGTCGVAEGCVLRRIPHLARDLPLGQSSTSGCEPQRCSVQGRPFATSGRSFGACEPRRSFRGSRVSFPPGLTVCSFVLAGQAGRVGPSYTAGSRQPMFEGSSSIKGAPSGGM